MASRRDYYYRQLVTEAELDAGFDALEQADRAIMTDVGHVGVLSLAVVAQHAGTPNLTVDISGPGVGYDQFGQRILIPTLQTKDLSVDDSAVSTTVGAGGNEKWVSLVVKFARLLSDPRVDGNSNTVYFVRDEAFSFSVVQGAENTIGNALRPTLPSNGLLLADIHRTNGQTQILNADIDTTRRMDNLVAAGSPHPLRRGLPKDAFSDILGWLNGHLAGSTDKHNAAAINYLGGAAWADATTNPAADLETALDKIFTDLNSTSGSGADKIGSRARTSWLGGRTNAAGTLWAAVDKIITDLGATNASDDGAERIGAEAISGFSAGSVRSQLGELGPSVNGTAFSATKTFNGTAADTTAAINTTYALTNRKLLWEAATNTAAKVRLYVGPTTFEISFNCAWGGSTWVADNTGVSAGLIVFGVLGMTLNVKNSGMATPWTVWLGTTALNVQSGSTTLNVDNNGVTGAAGITMDGLVAYAGDSSGAIVVGSSSSFRAKFNAAPSSVTYSTTGLPADVNITTAFSQANTTFTTTGIFVTATATGAGAVKHVRNYAVS